MHGAKVDAGCRVTGIDGQNLLIERNGALLFGGFLSLHRLEESVVRVAARRTQRRRIGNSRRAFQSVGTLEVKQQLAADRVNHGAVMAKGNPRAGTHHAGFEQRIGHAGYRLHGQDGIADGSGRHGFLAQNAQRAQLAKILEGINLLLRNQSGSLPPLQLAGTDLHDAQHVLTAIAGHSSLLP